MLPSDSAPLWLTALHVVLVSLYLGAPIALFIAAHRRRKVPVAIATLSAGVVAGCVLIGGYAYFVTGNPLRVGVWQLVLTCYVCTGLITLLKGLDLAVAWGLGRLTMPLMKRGNYYTRRSVRAVVRLGRVAVMALLALPILATAASVYRPKVVPDVVPPVPFTTFEVEASDGTSIVGWYLEPKQPEADVVLVVPGLGSGKADVIGPIMELWDAGLAVVVIDPRAHGESGGQLTTFGALESRDVVAARGWIERNLGEPRTFGLGVSMGGAAVLGAAADGADFDAVAVVDTYDDLPRLIDVLIFRQLRFAPPVRWAAERLTIPLLSLHTGQPLWRQEPRRHLDDLWPTPLLVVHSLDDELIPFTNGRRLYVAASEPKRRVWIEGPSHNEVLSHPRTIDGVVAFFRDASLFEPVVRR
jgi:alpha-beta hydrolase superfamily lysophospholipase